MSATTFIEATSADPFVRDLHRKAVRLLNDPSLDRQQREFHVRRLQSILLEHQAKEAAKAEKLAAKTAKREQVSRANRNQGVADPSQVVARRKEIALRSEVTGNLPVAVKVEEVEQNRSAPPKATSAIGVMAANDSHVTGRSRTVLSLKRA